MEALALLLIDFWRLPSTDVLTKRTDNLSSRTLVNNSDIYEDFQNGNYRHVFFYPQHLRIIQIRSASPKPESKCLVLIREMEPQQNWPGPPEPESSRTKDQQCWKQMIKRKTRQQGGRSNNSENKDPTGAWGTIPPRWGQSKTQVENTRGQLRLRA